MADSEFIEPILTDIFLVAMRTGISVTAAIKKDGRVSNRSYSIWQRERPDLIAAAKDAALATLNDERKKTSEEIAKVTAETQGRVQEKLLNEQENNIDTLISIRDNARSDYVRSQCALALQNLANAITPEAPEKLKELPRRTGLPINLLAAGAQSIVFQAPDGSKVSLEKAPPPDLIIEPASSSTPA